ncbi:DUF4402 domain-containing protein [Aurantiacibacter luteus]|uniref:Lipid/polyisoprenoid-binding YceI-like domain-containing protein n=1 Tax=Aurantiacibacter luteus TaxID=1581420 RepID=A0A0G9MY23_9SPHN|nr:DUF4402 domain-containing protein [Aurantiacibacter luteus]KLE34158.1 hypothetical protein AAW00_07735 [Aurantiacibacter luteus]
MSPRRRLSATLAALTAASLAWTSPLGAAVPSVRIVPESDLRFGTFMVFGSGSRTVSATGLVTDNSIVALEGNPTGPARFTVSYDRGNESNHILDIELDVVVSPVDRTVLGGVEGRLSAFQTDLSGAGAIVPGRPIRVRLRNCRNRVCSQSFSVGARLDVTRSYGGADLVIPIPVDAAVVSVIRQTR